MKNLIFTLVLTLASFQLFAQCSLTIDSYQLQNINPATGECDLFVCYSWQNAIPSFDNGSANIYFNIFDQNGVKSGTLIIDNNVPYGSSGSNCGAVSITGNPGNYIFTSPVTHYIFESFTSTIGGANEVGISFDIDFEGTCLAPSVVYTQGGGSPTCNDGIMNGDETGVDCGGSSCAACCTDNSFTISVIFDDYASETSWNISTLDGVIVATGEGYTDGDISVTGSGCAPDDCYIFNIYDAFGDGICCVYGEGSYTLTDANNTVLVSGDGEFGTASSHTFCFEAPPAECSLTIDSYELQNVNPTTGTYDFDICYSWINAPGDGSDIINIFFNLIKVDGTQAGFLIFDNNILSASSGSDCKTMSVTGNPGNYTFTSPIAPFWADAFTSQEGGAYESGLSFNLDFNGSCITPNTAYPVIAPPCGIPTGLTETDLTFFSVTLNWDGQTDATSYQLAGKKAGGNVKVFPPTNSTSRAFSNGIQSNTTYLWSVRALCDGVWTDYAPVQQFTTPESPSKNMSSFDIFDDVENTLTSNIYPNPATNEVNVKFMSSTQGDVQVNILDLTGRVVMTQTVQSDGWETEARLNISDLQNGYYLVEVNNGVTNATSKLNVIR